MDSIQSFFLNIPTPFNMVVAIVFITAAMGAIRAVAVEAGKYAVRKRELDFKREMIDRGLEVDEVERLLASGNQPGGKKWDHFQ